MRRTYSEMLRDIRWQQRSLEIRIRDGFMCTQCGQNEGEMHVHHLRYEHDRAPWDYRDEYLTTLCAPCHARWHEDHPLSPDPDNMPRCHVCNRIVTNRQGYGWGDGLTWCEPCANRADLARTMAVCEVSL